MGNKYRKKAKMIAKIERMLNAPTEAPTTKRRGGFSLPRSHKVVHIDDVFRLTDQYNPKYEQFADNAAMTDRGVTIEKSASKKPTLSFD